MDSDFLLIQKMKMGDEDAIESFVRKYYPMMLRYCHLHVGDYGYAEDVTQEVFERFFRTFDQYQHYGKAANYLYAIAANACRDFYRKKREIAVEHVPEQADSGMDAFEEKLDVHAAVGCLPQELREVAILFFFQEVRQKEIARILGIGLPLVKFRVRRAKELLAGYLREEGYL